jgi:hypothetical protein
MEIKDRIFWVQNANSSLYNDGQYKVRLLNDKVVGVGDNVLVKFSNGNFVGKVKQTAGFGNNWDFETISIAFPGRSNGKKIHISKILDKA